MRRIGVLISTGDDDPERQRLLKTFRDKLRTFGWIEGRNLEFILDGRVAVLISSGRLPRNW